MADQPKMAPEAPANGAAEPSIESAPNTQAPVERQKL
jgi:hypothetical protein